MNATEDELFHFGAIVATHGIRGDLKVRPFTPASTVLCEASAVVLRADDGRELMAVPSRTTVHKGNVLLRLRDYENINLVEKFVGCDVLMPRSEVPDSEDEIHYWQDVRGFEVFDRRRGFLGTLDDLFTTAAHDIYIVNGPFGEVLIPVVEAFIPEVDRDNRRMTVDLPEGLVPETDGN